MTRSPIAVVVDAKLRTRLSSTCIRQSKTSSGGHQTAQRKTAARVTSPEEHTRRVRAAFQGRANPDGSIHQAWLPTSLPKAFEDAKLGGVGATHRPHKIAPLWLYTRRKRGKSRIDEESFLDTESHLATARLPISKTLSSRGTGSPHGPRFATWHRQTLAGLGPGLWPPLGPSRLWISFSTTLACDTALLVRSVSVF